MNNILYKKSKFSLNFIRKLLSIKVTTLSKSYIIGKIQPIQPSNDTQEYLIYKSVQLLQVSITD